MAPRENIRLGVVPYLNVQPLIAHLSSPVDCIEIVADIPSRLALLLEERAVDVAIVPTFALMTHPQWSMIPNVGIASDGPIESVVVVSASPRERIQRIYLDPSSMTSVALVQILFRHHWCQDIEFIRRSRVRVASEEGTGYLVIGDPALKLRRQWTHVLDLGEAWRAFTGLPFVYAVWAVRPGVDLGPLASRLQQAPEHLGDDLFRQIAREHAREIGITVADAHHYLRDCLRYRLGRQEMLGMRQFLRACQALGLGPSGPVRLRLLRSDARRRELG